MKTENTRRYSSVAEMLRGIGLDSDVVEGFEAQVKADSLSEKGIPQVRAGKTAHTGEGLRSGRRKSPVG